MDGFVDRLSEGGVRLPDHDVLSVRRLQHLGMELGTAEGFETLHWLLDEAFCAVGDLSDSFLGTVREQTSFDHNPLFAAIHESIYAQHGQPTGWGAERLLTDFPQFGRRLGRCSSPAR